MLAYFRQILSVYDHNGIVHLLSFRMILNLQAKGSLFILRKSSLSVKSKCATTLNLWVTFWTIVNITIHSCCLVERNFSSKYNTVCETINKEEVVTSNCFLIHLSNIWICVISCVYLASWSSICLCCMTITLTLVISCKLFNQISHTCHAYRHHWLIPFYITYNDLNLSWES